MLRIIVILLSNSHQSTNSGNFYLLQRKKPLFTNLSLDSIVVIPPVRRGRYFYFESFFIIKFCIYFEDSTTIKIDLSTIQSILRICWRFKRGSFFGSLSFDPYIKIPTVRRGRYFFQQYIYTSNFGVFFKTTATNNYNKLLRIQFLESEFYSKNKIDFQGIKVGFEYCNIINLTRLILKYTKSPVLHFLVYFWRLLHT